MSDTEYDISEPPVRNPEYLKAELRVQHWATTAGRQVSKEEFENKFHAFHDEEKNKAQMKTRAAAQRERRVEVEKKVQKMKALKSPPPSKLQATGEAMETETVLPASSAPSHSGPTPRMAPERKTTKRTVEKIIDPDSGKDAPDPKRSNVPLDKEIKRLCLKSILEMFGWLLVEARKRIQDEDCLYNLNVSNALVSIIFTTHNILRQRQNNNAPTNMQTKSASTDFPISFKGKTYTIGRAQSERSWREILTNNDLSYSIDKDSDKNWIGTMGPYLNMLGCWGLRLQELHVGHTKMPVARDGDKMSVVPIEKYGLSRSSRSRSCSSSRRHHVSS